MTEKEIRKIIREVLNEELKKMDKIEDKLMFDLSKIPQEELDKQYVEYSKQYNFVSYCNPLSKTEKGYVFESFGEVLPPDSVVHNIIRAHRLKEWQFKRVEYCNKVDIYILIPDIGDNVKIINEDMDKMGYFVGQDYVVPEGGWRQIHYEPKEQEDNTDEVRKHNTILLHLTPYYNVSNIMRLGLIPKNSNLMFSYPDRVYMITQNVTDVDFNNLGNGLSMRNMDSRNNGRYVLLRITLSKVPSDIKFYYDPNMPDAVYTTQGIPSECISVYGEYEFEFE